MDRKVCVIRKFLLQSGHQLFVITLGVLLMLFVMQAYLVQDIFGSNTGVSYELTEVEKNFIRDNPVIKTGVDPEFKPYEFIDTDGIYKGFAADYLKLIAERTGLTFEVQKNLSWVETYDLALAGEIDVLPCVGITPQREELFNFTDSYLNYQRAIFSRLDSPIYGLSDIEDIRIGVQKNSSHNSYLASETNVKPVLFNNNDELLLALSYGEIDGAITNYASASYRMKELGLTNIGLDYVFDDDLDEFGIAVNKDKVLLLSIMNKALRSITEEEKINIRNKWIGVEKKTNTTQYVFGTLASLALLSIFIYWTFTLKKEIKYRKQIEKELVIAQDAALKASEAKSRFLAHMSHEIRTPLNAITGQTYLLENTTTSMVQKKYIRGIKNASYNLLNTINDILDFSKIEAGEVDVEHIAFKIDDVLDKVSTMLSSKAAEKGLDFHVKKDTMLPQEIISDPTKIEQILINFVNNAIKFTKEGEVRVEVELLKCEHNLCQLRFIVKDSGIGMTQEQQQYLFIPFHQLDSSITRQFGGTGLGLSICKNLADLLGATIAISSSPGEGSQFSMDLPVLTHEHMDEERITKPDFRGLRALIVDQDVLAKEIVFDYLNSYKFTVESALTIKEALKMLDEEHGMYDLILLEMNMPGQNSFEVLQVIKDTSTNAILMASKINEAQYEMAESYGVKHIIMKPIIASILYDSVVQCFSVRQNFDLNEMPSEQTKVEYHHKVLLVEDHVVNQMIEQEILEQRGYTVVIANNGQEAVNLVKTDAGIEIVLMDIHMPIMDGYEATREIRRFNTTIPILAMTAVSYEEVGGGFKEVGMNGYVTKPIDPVHLFKEIDNYLHRMKTKETINPKEMTLEDKLMACNHHDYMDVKQGLNRIGNNAKLYFEVIHRFHEDMVHINEDVSELIENQEYHKASELVHKIKGCAGNIGANKLFQSSNTLMNGLRNGIEIDYGPYLWEFENDVKGTLKATRCMIDEIDLGSLTVQVDQEGQKDQVDQEDLQLNSDVEALINRMETLLDNSDLDAFKVMDEMAVKMPMNAPSWLKIKDAMAKYDFQQAREHLRALKNHR